MAKYLVPVVWQMSGMVEVEAKSAEDAFDEAEQNRDTYPLPEGFYVGDSFEIDRGGCVMDEFGNIATDDDEPHVFPVITKEIQKSFEQKAYEFAKDTTPEICGFYGRACRQMEKTEGANRALCTDCPLKDFAEGRC